MKTAISVANNRLAPVFDVSHHVLILEWKEGEVISRLNLCIEENALSTLAELKSHGVSQLVCGAISKPIQKAAGAIGVEVFGFLTGEVEDIIEALINGQLHTAILSMPGCQRNGRRCGHGRRRGV